MAKQLTCLKCGATLGKDLVAKWILQDNPLVDEETLHRELAKPYPYIKCINADCDGLYIEAAESERIVEEHRRHWDKLQQDHADPEQFQTPLQPSSSHHDQQQLVSTDD